MDLSLASNPPVIERYIGTVPMISMATKIPVKLKSNCPNINYS
jgi:hypothetical protein